MKHLFETNSFRLPAVLLCCSSHEDRCLGILSRITEDKPCSVVLFHHDDPNPRREENHKKMLAKIDDLHIKLWEIPYTKNRPVHSLTQATLTLQEVFKGMPDATIFLDISVLTRRHLLMLCQWFDDMGYWDRLQVVYSEPENYYTSDYIPLSFGLHSFEPIPGLPACPDFSRSIHLMLFLGYEGDRALAAFDYIQPEITTLVIPNPPYRPEWIGRTERFNAEIIKLIGQEHILRVDPINPAEVVEMLEKRFGRSEQRSKRARVIVPLGTKPQALGAYMYARQCVDQPCVIYARPLRHNQTLYSHGTGNVWRIK